MLADSKDTHVCLTIEVSLALFGISMSSRHAAVLSLVLTCVPACAENPMPPQTPIPTGGVGGGRAGTGGAVAMPTGGRGPTGGSAGSSGSTAAGSGGAGGAAGSAVAMGVAGMYADEFPTCEMSNGSAGMTGSAGAAAGAGAGAGGRSGGGSGGSRGAGGTGATSTPAPFSEVYTIINCNGCGLCHGGQGGLTFTGGKSEVYEGLVGSDPMGKPAGTVAEGGLCTGQRRVVPGMPEQSVLLAKVAGTQMCGAAMPPTGATFTAAQVERIRSWIAAGAKKN